MDRKILGLPLPVVGGILGLALVALFYMRASASRATTSTNGNVNTDVAGALEGDGSANDEATSSTGTSSSSTYVTNALWEAAAVAYLTSQGNSPLTVEAALDDYIAGNTLTDSEQVLVNAAIAKFGIPPEGVTSVTLAKKTTTASTLTSDDYEQMGDSVSLSQLSSTPYTVGTPYVETGVTVANTPYLASGAADATTGADDFSTYETYADSQSASGKRYDWALGRYV